ncbi:hypothetical protein RSOLAG1IB_07527 [Rhizoctonia solani AG-1 IB]|uniref:MOSC domain-containing protein n=1 Tax=Thanatephorus cucumeris (strain AG1-IB / isolate 7/3/14) TaxID=1108050 RepID=A0A0B7FGR7_THACB|nr:hypothetical protein RSOLAG1IB_07527 [Rhizoctonia solani AG-1 IB]
MFSLTDFILGLRYLIVGSYLALSRTINHAFALGPSSQKALSSSPTTTSTGLGSSSKDRLTVMATSKLALAEDVDMKVTKLLVHPIKSCRGISVSESKITSEGLQYDRQYMIVDAKTHKFITARQIPKMVLAETVIEGGQIPLLSVSFPQESGIQSFKTCLEPSPETLANWELISDVEVWASTGLDAYVVESHPLDSTNSPSKLFSSYLGRDVLLVLKGPKPRPAVPTSTHPDLDDKVRLSAAGEDKWKVGGITSHWQTNELVIERFRPNIIVSGSPAPFDEDYWGDVRIGKEGSEGAVISLVARCARCLLPNIDTTTGIRDNAVPFKVISKFRQVEPEKGTSACFGMNAITQSSGLLKVGDSVRVLNVLERETVETQISN